MKSLVLAIATSIGLSVALSPRPAAACGGCFHPVTDNPTIVTDHRMALSVSMTQTVLWDQIKYDGAPQEFAWVLPIRPGSRVELSHDAFLAALDATTAPRVHAPRTSCGGGAEGDTSGEAAPSGGCGAGGGTAESFATATTKDAGGYQGSDGVSVVSQETIGPYAAVTIRGSDGMTIDSWLMANGFDVPASLAPVLSSYTAAKMDFIALRLRPGVSTQAMQPVRVISPGADPTLPLRMVAAGVGAKVSITLFVLGDGRYHPRNFPDVAIDPAQLLWDPLASHSNYGTLADAALASNDGTGWLTEFSGRMSTTSQIASGQLGLFDEYMSVCATEAPVTVPCGMQGGLPLPLMSARTVLRVDGQRPSIADGVIDGGAEGGAASDGGSDGGGADGGADGGSCTEIRPACSFYDDIDTAMSGRVSYDLWVTRLRANLPVKALANDLSLEATAYQTEVGNVLVASGFTDPHYQPCPNGLTRSNGATSGGCVCDTTRATRSPVGSGTIFLMVGTALLLSRVLRRR